MPSAHEMDVAEAHVREPVDAEDVLRLVLHAEAARALSDDRRAVRHVQRLREIHPRRREDERRVRLLAGGGEETAHRLRVVRREVVVQPKVRRVERRPRATRRDARRRRTLQRLLQGLRHEARLQRVGLEVAEIRQRLLVPSAHVVDGRGVRGAALDESGDAQAVRTRLRLDHDRRIVVRRARLDRDAVERDRGGGVVERARRRNRAVKRNDRILSRRVLEVQRQVLIREIRRGVRAPVRRIGERGRRALPIYDRIGLLGTDWPMGGSRLTRPKWTGASQQTSSPSRRRWCASPSRTRGRPGSRSSRFRGTCPRSGSP